MYEVWESKDDEGDQIRALKMASGLVRLIVADTSRARYYLNNDERRQLAAFLLDGLEGGDADSAKDNLTGAEYAELSKLIRRAALNDAISAVEESEGTAIGAIHELYDNA